MKILFFDIGEARILYGSAASLKKNHEVYILKSAENSDKDVKIDKFDLEIGSNNNVQEIYLRVIKTSYLSDEKFRSRFKLNIDEIEKLVKKIDPDIIVTGSYYWFIAKRISLRLNKPLIFWNTVVPSIFKLPIFLKISRNYFKILTSPVGLIYNIFIGTFSDYIINNDLISTKFYKRLSFKKVETIWPTYTKFKKTDAYSEFMNSLENSNHALNDLGHDYALSIVTLNKNSPVYKIELNSLDFILKVAKISPDTNFIIMGTSKEDILNTKLYQNLKNVKFLGKIYDDSIISELYNNAYCIICPIIIPGFVNRILEAFFYGKAIISTPNIAKYYDGLEDNNNIKFAKNHVEAAKNITEILLNENLRTKLEKNSNKYYSKFFSPQVYSTKMEKILK